MDAEEFLKCNNPPRGETYVFYCGKNFLDDLEEAFKHNKNKDSLT